MPTFLFYFLVFSVLKMVTFLSVSACCPCVCSRNCLGCSDVWQFKDYQVIHVSQHIPQFERKKISFLLVLLYRSIKCSCWISMHIKVWILCFIILFPIKYLQTFCLFPLHNACQKGRELFLRKCNWVCQVHHWRDCLVILNLCKMLEIGRQLVKICLAIRYTQC